MSFPKTGSAWEAFSSIWATRGREPPRGTTGGYFGHVEMVALGTTGQRLYVSDSPRCPPGGHGSRQFYGTGLASSRRGLWRTPAADEDINPILEERKRLALQYFNRKGEQVATLSPAFGQ